MKILNYKVVSQVTTSETSKGTQGIVIAEITIEQKKFFFRETKTETFLIKILRSNQYYHNAKRVDNNKYVGNVSFSEHITDLIKNEIFKAKNNLNK